MTDDSIYVFSMFYLSAIVSPGPSMFMILSNSMNFSANHGIFCALGTVLGIAVQFLFTLYVIGYLNQYSIFISFLGLFLGLYLCYKGLKILFSTKNNNEKKVLSKIYNTEKSLISSLKEGFITDTLNPLALSFFFSIFTIYFPFESDYLTKVSYFFVTIFIGFVWYLGIALLMANRYFRKIIFHNCYFILNILLGTIMLYLSFILCYSNVNIVIEGILELEDLRLSLNY